MSYKAIKEPINEALDADGLEDVDSDNTKTESASFLDRSFNKRNTHNHDRNSRSTWAKRLAFIGGMAPWIINFILVVALISLSKSMSSKSVLPPTDMIYTLAADQIEYRLETTYAGDGYPESPYQGWPTDASDKLWEEYEKGNNLHVDHTTASKLHFMTQHVAEKSEEHKDEYIVGLAVFHNLHCLNAIRKGFYHKRYNSSLLDADGTVNFHRWHHIDHCIENIRRYITCHADTSAMTYEWIPESQMVIHPETLHVCRNFEKIRDWAAERYVTASQRAHVEGGHTVDYAGKPYGPEWDKVETKTPKDWAYTEDDL